MPAQRLIRILARLALEDGTEAAPRLCVVCAEITEVDGAGIMLLADGHPQGSVCTSDDISSGIEELQYTLGEGPCIDAHRQHAPIAEPDLSDPATRRVREVWFGDRSVLAVSVDARPLAKGVLELLDAGADVVRRADRPLGMAVGEQHDPGAVDLGDLGAHDAQARRRLGPVLEGESCEDPDEALGRHQPPPTAGATRRSRSTREIWSMLHLSPARDARGARGRIPKVPPS